LPNDFGQKGNAKWVDLGRHWYRWNTATTLNDRIAVDVRDWQRRELLVRAAIFPWLGRSTAKSRIAFSRVEHDRVTPLQAAKVGGGLAERRRTITLTSTPCHFGGRRVWFVCPRCYDPPQTLFVNPLFSLRIAAAFPMPLRTKAITTAPFRRARIWRDDWGPVLVVGDPNLGQAEGDALANIRPLKEEAERADEIADIYFVAGALRHYRAMLPR